jgi:hypothetical protein
MADLEFTATTDFNADGEFSECEVDMSWATLQVKALVEASGNVVSIGGDNFTITDDASFLTAVKAQHTLNVGGTVAVDGCGDVSSLPLGVSLLDTQYSLENPIAYYRFNDYPRTSVDQIIQNQTPTTFLNSVTGIADGQVTDGGWQWTKPGQGAAAYRSFALFGTLTLGGVDSGLGNGDWTIHLRLNPRGNQPPAVVINKANKLRLIMYGAEIQVQSGGQTLKITKAYSTYNDQENYITITNKIREDFGADLTFYMNGEKLGSRAVGTTTFTSDELNSPFTIFQRNGLAKDVLVLGSAVEEESAIKMGSGELPFIPRFYHALDLTREESWQTDAHKVSFRGEELTIQGPTQWQTPWFEKSDADGAGWQGQLTTRPSLRVGFGSHKITTQLDLSKDFTVSFWVYFENSPGTFLEIIDNDNSAKKLSLSGWAGARDLWLSHTNKALKRAVGSHKGVVVNPNNEFDKNYWQHVTMVKNGATIAFWINGKYLSNYGGNYISLSASDIDNQAESTLIFSGKSNFIYLSDLKIWDSAIIQPFVWSLANEYPEIENVMGDYFYD